jgi:hypothetical protein
LIDAGAVLSEGSFEHRYSITVIAFCDELQPLLSAVWGRRVAVLVLVRVDIALGMSVTGTPQDRLAESLFVCVLSGSTETATFLSRFKSRAKDWSLARRSAHGSG